jgi:hypothetical protein
MFTSPPSAVDHIDPTFNPPLDVSFFGKIEAFHPSSLALSTISVLLDASHVRRSRGLAVIHADRDRVATSWQRVSSGAAPGLRRNAMQCREALSRSPKTSGAGRARCRRGPRQRRQAADTVKFLLSNDDVFVDGGAR